eukprot:NODE_44_length_28780_cov_0.148496.p14 type:complete len:126 gc:universal NODE_44_length_28780_cov_0.148496:14227-13850(-)
MLLSCTCTVYPCWFNKSAAAKPQGPLPTIPILYLLTILFWMILLESCCTQFISKALSIIEHSILFMLTGSLIMFRTHASLHGAGQALPVNSGKLFVRINDLYAEYQSLLAICWFHWGIKLPIGQP